MRQLSLFGNIDQAFAAFHQRHPEVYRLFCQFVSEVRRLGHANYSADAILHRVRWEVDLARRPAVGWKINNNFSSRYARKYMREHRAPDFFRIRKLRP